MSEESGDVFQNLTKVGLSSLLSAIELGLLEVLEELRESYAKDIPTELLRQLVMRRLAQTFHDLAGDPYTLERMGDTETERDAVMQVLGEFCGALESSLFRA